VALIGQTASGETPLTEQDLQGLKHPFVKTREQLSVVEAQNILNGKEWALASKTSRIPGMLSVEYLQELHRRMLGDVWEWAGEIRPTQLQNAFASSVSDIRPHLSMLYQDAVEYWLKDQRMSSDELAVRLHHRVVKIHPFRNGNGRHSRLLADVLLEKHFGLQPFSWGGNAQLGNSDPNRQSYLDALRAADKGDYSSLIKLCRAG
jgi:Fic-DOC domain mobile mystery protein B